MSTQKRTVPQTFLTSPVGIITCLTMGAITTSAISVLIVFATNYSSLPSAFCRNPEQEHAVVFQWESVGKSLVYSTATESRTWTQYFNQRHQIDVEPTLLSDIQLRNGAPEVKVRESVGLPLQCLEHYRLNAGNGSWKWSIPFGTEFRVQMPLPDRFWHVGGEHFTILERRIPLKILPARFVANVVGWSGAWATVFLLVNMCVKYLRLSRGKCVRCGYSRDGLPNCSPCPECGAEPPVPVSTRINRKAAG